MENYLYETQWGRYIKGKKNIHIFVCIQTNLFNPRNFSTGISHVGITSHFNYTRYNIGGCIISGNSYQLFLAFLRFRTVITSFCLSPSTSANLRLISEYLSCISFSSLSINWFFSFNDANSETKLSRLLSLLSVAGALFPSSDAISSLKQRKKYSQSPVFSRQDNVFTLNHD